MQASSLHQRVPVGKTMAREESQNEITWKIRAPKHRSLLRLLSPKPDRHGLPDGARVYAVGDIHGRSDLLDRLLNAIRADAVSGPEKQTLIFLGDYIDRGPDSKGVIERLIGLPMEFETRFLRGNHDQAILDFLADPTFFRTWREFGGLDTLVSYGVCPPRFQQKKLILEVRAALVRKMPQSHFAFLKNLEPYAEIGSYFFTHAGVRPGVPLKAQRSEDLMWIRDDFLTSTADFGKIIVHGHSPENAPIRTKNRIGIDTGAYATGKLTAAVLEGAECRFLQT